jgi:hypothetical protein
MVTAIVLTIFYYTSPGLNFASAPGMIAFFPSHSILLSPCHSIEACGNSLCNFDQLRKNDHLFAANLLVFLG